MKIINRAAMIVGSIATVAQFIPGPWQPFAATVAAVAGITAAASGQFINRKPSILGASTQFKADPNAGIPYMIGRTLHAGNIVHRASWGDDNEYQGFVVVWSGGGPVSSIEEFLVDYEAVSFDGSGAAIGTRFADWMWLTTQLGECPEASALAPAVGSLPDWGASYKLSGYFAGIWIIKFDKKGKKYAGGVPVPGMVAQSVKVYDPRLDSTYPGGSGPCRALDETTYVESENGPLHTLTYALGRWQGPTEDKQRVMGVGMAPDQIEIDQFVDAANAYDANGWKVGGTLYSTDNKWAAMKSMMLTAAGEPMQLGARLACHMSAPRVSIATIQEQDLAGDVQFVGTNSRRDRPNTIIPRFRSEDHSWQMTPASAVTFNDLVTQDRGRRRTEELELTLVQQLDQAAQVSAYRILNFRERGPITIRVKPMWVGLRPGDCVTLDLPTANLPEQKAVIRRRRLMPEDGSVQLTLVTETDEKHDLALETLGSVGPPISLTPPEPSDGSLLDDEILQLYIANSWPEFTTSGSEASDVGTDVTLHIDAHDRVYLDKTIPVDDGDITALPFGTTVFIYYDDPDRLGGSVVYEFALTQAEALNSAANISRHYVGEVTTPADGAADTPFEPYTP